ncbi:MAG: RHS repeat protein, partial [Muribaculaceae bacterium]|nr:RHS repeat protein [Muribaculaceae bacterium]
DLPDGIYSIQLLDPINIGNLPSNFVLADYFDVSKFWDSGHIYIEVETRYTPTNEDGTPVTYWPGARVKSISYNPNDGTEPINKDYYYDEYKHESGLVQHEPIFNYKYYGFVKLLDTHYGDALYEAHVVTDKGLPNSPLGGNEVEYPQVRTRFTRGVHEPDDVNGYYTYHTESYYYTSFDDKRNCDLCETPMVNFQLPSSRMYTSNAHRRGLLYKKISGFQSPMITTEYSYSLHEDSDTPFLTTDLFSVTDYVHTSEVGIKGYNAHDYHIGKYRIIPYSRTIDKEVTIEQVSSTVAKRDSIEYTYYEPTDKYTGFMQPQRLKRSMTRWDSSGNKITTYYTYRGFSYQLTDKFWSKLWIPTPETEITTVGDENPRVVKALRRRFIRRTDRVEAVMSTSNLSNITIRHNTPTTPTEYQNLINEPKYSYQYDKDGNIVQISYKNMAVCSYLWAHQGCYPVLEAKNISYDTLLAALTHANISQDEMSKLETLSAAKWLDVRNSIAQLAPQAEVTQLTYSPLIGILSATDAAGLTTTYNYDNRGRLIEIKDFNGFLIEKYEYHFKGF